MQVPENKRVIYRFGRFDLDPRERTLRADGVAQRMPAKEFETLVLLVERRGEALTKDEMMSALWRDSFVEEGNLAKQISRLRKIFETAGGGEYIETIPKFGYRFRAPVEDLPLPDPSDTFIGKAERTERFALTFEAEPPGRAAAAPRRFALIAAGVLAVAVVAAAAAAVGLLRLPAPAASGGVNSVAVLPLRPLGDSERTRALGLGLTDALIVKLGSLRRIVVRPTAAVAALGSDAEPIDAGRRLAVDAVLDGTIQESDGRLRVTARLLRTGTGEQIWADRFEQPAADIFALQDALSANIAKNLAFELSKANTDALTRRGTSDERAYEAFLRGQFYRSQNTLDGLNKSIDLYEQAIALDPAFAEAYTGVADANIVLY